MRLHEAARRNGKASKKNKVDVDVVKGIGRYEQMWRDVMRRQKEEEGREERKYVEKWLGSVE